MFQSTVPDALSRSYSWLLRAKEEEDPAHRHDRQDTSLFRFVFIFFEKGFVMFLFFPPEKEGRKVSDMVARLAFLVPNSKILALFENSWHFIC